MRGNLRLCSPGDQIGWPLPMITGDAGCEAFKVVCITGVAEHGFHTHRSEIVLDAAQAAVVRVLQLCRDKVASPEILREECATRFGLSLSEQDLDDAAGGLQRLGLVTAKTDAGPVECLATLRSGLRQAVREQQTRLLRRALRRWREEIPYYREKLADIDPEHIDLDSLRQIPVLSKEEIRRELPRLMPSRMTQRFNVDWERSSGTTGDRLQTAHLGRYWWHTFLTVCQWGERTPLPIAVLGPPACTGTECHMAALQPFEQRWDAGRAMLFLGSHTDPANFATATLEQMLDELRSLGVRTLIADSAYLAGLALFMRERGLQLPELRLILLTFSVNSELHKQLFREVLTPNIVELYGTTEAGNIGLECPCGGLHHVSPALFHVELLDDHGAPVAAGELGRIHLTALQKNAMPLLRYAIGDLARAVDGSTGTCDGVEPTIGLIEGRASDLITATSGEVLTPRQVDAAIARADAGVVWYSLVQQDVDAYRLLCIPSTAGAGVNETALDDVLHELLGGKARLVIEQTRALVPSASGKYRLCYRAGSWLERKRSTE